MRRGNYIPFALGKGATTLHLQCLLFLPRMHKNGQICDKHKYFTMYQIYILLVCFTPCVFKYLVCKIFGQGQSSCSTGYAQPSVALSPSCSLQINPVPAGGG